MAVKEGSQLSPIVEVGAAEGSNYTASSKSPPVGKRLLDPKETPWQKKSSPRSWSLHWISLLFSSLWLAPIITLLVLNFKEHVIGASDWCPYGKCPSDAFNSDAVATAVRLNKKDHDVFTGLQFVAQAFEIWFLIVVMALLYDVTMLLARSNGGLPVGYVLTHLEFHDAKNLFNLSLWTSAFASKGASTEERRHKSVTRLFLFAMFAALLTVLTNLMGAASAVLLLPNLSWIETEKVPQQMFDGIAISQAPQNETLFANDCSNAHLLAGNFSCTSDLYGPSLDEWAAKAQSSIKQSEQPNGVAILATSQESAIQFALNASDNLKLIWIANRQVLRDISGDYLKAIGLNDDHSQVNGKVDTGSADPRFNNSLETRLQRTGPSIGVQANCFAGNVSVTLVGKEKEIHCFSHWSLDGAEDHYTKCLRIGRGFNGNNNQSTFSLGGSSSSEIKPATSVDSFSSDLATFYNSTADFGSGIARCLLNDTAPTCDWDRIFATPLPPELHNSSVNVGVISYSVPNAPSSQARVYCDSITYLGFPFYSLDTSISSNELNLVQLDHLDVTDYNKPLVVNPDWFLAAWSVNRNGTEDGTRLITREMRRAVNLFWYDQSAINSLQMFFYHVYALGQAMSMVNYYHSPPTSGQTPESQEATDPDRPIFTTWAQLHVWAWGLDGRLSTVLGCICVIARVVLGLCVARREYSVVEILVAALEQKPEGVFEGMERERDMARVRYMVRDESDGRLGLGPASGS